MNIMTLAFKDNKIDVIINIFKVYNTGVLQYRLNQRQLRRLRWRKPLTLLAFVVISWICFDHDNFESIVTLKYFAWSYELLHVWALLCKVYRKCTKLVLLVICRNSHFWMLNSISHLVAHSYNVCRSCWRWWQSSSEWMVL